ncbi:MAG: oligosaccharide flippase family protein [Pseudomonas paracarnis]
MRRTIYIGCSFGYKTLCSLIVLRVLAVEFGEDGFGYLAQYMAFLAIIFGLSLGGATNFLIKNLSTLHEPEKFQNEISIVFSYGFVFLCMMALVLICLKRQLEEFVFFSEVSWWVIIYILVLFYISNVYGCLMAAALAQGKIRSFALSSICGSTIFTLAVVVSVWAGYADQIYLILPFSYVLPVVFLYRSYKGKIKLDFVKMFSERRVREIFRYSLIIYIGLVSLPLVSIFVRENYQSLYGPVSLSNWQVAVKFSDTLQQFFGMFCAAILLPYLSRNIHNFNALTWGVRLGGLAALYVPLAIIVLVFSGTVVFLLFGGGYDTSKEYLQYYLLGDLFRMCALFCSYTLISVDRFGRVLIFECLQGIIYVALYAYLPVSDNIAKVGYAYLLTYVICFCFMLVFVFSYFKRRLN